MKSSFVPARRRVLHLPEGIAEVYENTEQGGGGFDLRALCRDLWLAVEMQSLTPDFRLVAKPVKARKSSARGSGRPIQDIRLLRIPVRLDQAFARVARAHGFTPSVAMAFLMGWRAQHEAASAG